MTLWAKARRREKRVTIHVERCRWWGKKTVFGPDNRFALKRLRRKIDRLNALPRRRIPIITADEMQVVQVGRRT